MTSGEQTHTRDSRRAFAMLLAVLVVMVVAIVASVMLSRHVAQARAVRRQVDAYQVQHGVRGLQDVIRAWVGSRQPQDFGEMLDPDGYALTIEPGDGSELRVWFEPAQGLLLADTASAAMGVRADAELAVIELERLVGSDSRGRYLRSSGPAAVDAMSAPRPVLESLGIAAADGDVASAEEIASRIVDDRIGRDLSPGELRAIVESTRLSPEQSSRLMRLLTVEPRLWMMRAELWAVGPAGSDLVGAYAALVQLASRQGDRPSFLSWEDALAAGGERYVSPALTDLEAFRLEDFTIEEPDAREIRRNERGRP